MNRDDLFESLNDLDDDLLERSEQSVGGRRNVWLKWCTVAAGVALLTGGAVYGGLTMIPVRQELLPELESVEMTSNPTDGWQDMDQSVQPGTDEASDHGDNETRIQAQSEKFVMVSDLFPESSEELVQLQLSGAFYRVELGDYTALYSPVSAAIPDEKLADSLGSNLEAMVQWGLRDHPEIEGNAPLCQAYAVAGHRDLQYLIFWLEEDDAYTLVEFDSIQSSPSSVYPYQDILELVYGIDSADDIVKVVSRPSRMDNSDAGKAQQEAIGDLAITEQEDIEELYRIWCSMTCYGSNNWDKIQHLQSDAPEGFLESARLERYLTIETAWGNEIDSLKYTGLGDMFFEFGGVAYNVLSEEDAGIVEEILRIE